MTVKAFFLATRDEDRAALAEDAAAHFLQEQATLVGRASQHTAVLLSPAQEIRDSLSDLAVRDILVRLATLVERAKRRDNIRAISSTAFGTEIPSLDRAPVSVEVQ